MKIIKKKNENNKKKECKYMYNYIINYIIIHGRIKTNINKYNKRMGCNKF